MQATINTPLGTVYKSEIDQVTLSTETGEMQILPGHASLLGSLRFTPVTISNGEHEDRFLLRQGFVLIDNQKDEVKIFALAADKTESVDHKTLAEYLEFVLSKLENPEELNHYQVHFLNQQKASLEQMVEVIQK